ncbi:phosphate/phosphite/phosphonate ABC transporter substrate-binding protein [Microbacterium sp. Root53]|uniref:phosphate/phosphite/phosphonate ABC transporter substrate-binding protein n=1 Tax=Microbacterium sp. Root53 TaxID=1736553 RepID=UPI000B21111A|nr:phosphate/phosphite/phosphonate ABC transporter substrate-binding protein [Microbacterium sp. Root53]
MRLRTPLALGALAVGSALVLTGCSSASGEAAVGDDDVIRFATLPTSDDPSAATPIEELKTLLEEETGCTVEITDVPNYSAVIEAIRAGHEDIGIMSGFPSALAVATGEVDSLVAWPGTEEPVSTCLVLADSPLQSLEDITPDTVVAFAEPASSSGFFMPTHMLHEAGLTADEDFEVLFSGGHDCSFIALEQGQADVACTSTIFPSDGHELLRVRAPQCHGHLHHRAGDRHRPGKRHHPEEDHMTVVDTATLDPALEKSAPVNLRDLGGTPIDGGVLRPGFAIRADDLSYVTDEVAVQLVDAGLRSIIDLRSNIETAITGRGPLADMLRARALG